MCFWVAVSLNQVEFGLASAALICIGRVHQVDASSSSAAEREEEQTLTRRLENAVDSLDQGFDFNISRYVANWMDDAVDRYRDYDFVRQQGSGQETSEPQAQRRVHFRGSACSTSPKQKCESSKRSQLTKPKYTAELMDKSFVPTERVDQ